MEIGFDLMVKREIPVRRIRFGYPEASSDRHFVDGDLVMSHAVAFLSSVFPEGEDFFVRSVREFDAQITDPELRQRVKGFIGQEVTHGREHSALNDRLRAMGYPIGRGERATRRFNAVMGRRSPHARLAVTAALEHFTAVLAETLLAEPRARALLGTGEARPILLWHALEESEHRSVAFDVYRAVGGSERIRIRAMRVLMFTFTFNTAVHTLLSLAGDRAAYNPRRLFASLAALRHSPFLAAAVRSRLLDYLRPGFHPDDVDNTALLADWNLRLFGPEGELTPLTR